MTNQKTFNLSRKKVFFSLERLKKKSYFLCSGGITGWFIKMTQIREEYINKYSQEITYFFYKLNCTGEIFQRNYCSCIFVLPVDSNSLKYKQNSVVELRVWFFFSPHCYCIIVAFLFVCFSFSLTPKAILGLDSHLGRKIYSDLLEPRGEQKWKWRSWKDFLARQD